MKGLTFKMIIYRTIQIIRRERVSNVSHMHPNLVSTPCFQMDFQEGVIISDGEPLIMCDRSFAILRIDLTLITESETPGRWELRWFRTVE